jgi:hypothetical protein
MQLTLYPNSELRARVTAPPLNRRGGVSDVGMAGASILSIVEKLRSESESPFKAPRDLSPVRVGYGRKPRLTEFSLYGRRKIVRSGGLVGLGDRRQSTLFLTGTLPGGTNEALTAISEYSAWIVHELLTHIPRIAGVSVNDCKVIWVWEWQRRGALHLHAICEFPSRAEAQRVYDGFKGLWIRVLETVGRKSGCDIAARADFGSHSGRYDQWRTRAEWARKNPSRYLAKYVSKANKSTKFCENFPPTRWYGLSRHLHFLLRENTVFASTSDVTNIPDHRLGGDFDLELIELLFQKSHTTRKFSDKVRDGFTFVFYLREEELPEVRRLLSFIKEGGRMRVVREKEGSSRTSYRYLEVIPGYLRANSQFLASIGEYACDLLEIWYDGGEIPDFELVFLNNFAEYCLTSSGVLDRVKPPERSGAGLTGQSVGKMESVPAPYGEYEQSSLFP